VRTPVVLVFLALFGFTVAPAHASPSAVDDALARVVTADDLAGGVAVVRTAAEVSRHYAGVSDVETGAAFAPHIHVRVGSITKTFVAATIMQLFAEDRIDLDAPVETYLPGRVRGMGIDANAIAVRQLLRRQGVGARRRRRGLSQPDGETD
jgi:D-alanyl-D-alanine carboxypeptidase